jgi:hypothetical protein
MHGWLKDVSGSRPISKLTFGCSELFRKSWPIAMGLLLTARYLHRPTAETLDGARQAGIVLIAHAL